MNNKVLYVVGGIIAIVGIYFLISPNESISNPLNDNKNLSNNHLKKNIEKSLVKIDNTKNDKKVLQNEIKSIDNDNLSNDLVKSNENFKIEESNSKTFVNIDKKISKFIDDNNLQPIQKLKDIEIFAKNLPKKNEFAPPMPPTLVKVKFKSKSEIIPLNSDLINSNRKIYVVKKEGDKYSEIKEIDTKKLTSFTPPAIGQN